MVRRSLLKALTHLFLWAICSTLLFCITVRFSIAQGRPDVLWMVGGHYTNARSVAISPDGQFMASCSGDGTAKLWRVSDGALLRTLETSRNGYFSVRFSPNGQILAAGGLDYATTVQGIIRMWQVPSGNLIRTIPAHGTASVTSIAFSPNGELLVSGGRDNSLRLWRVTDGAQIRSMSHLAEVNCVAFAPNGQTIASAGNDYRVKIWRVSDGALLHNLWWHSNVVWSVDYSPDGSILAAGSYDYTITLWRVSDGTRIRTLYGHTNYIYNVSFTPDGQRLVSTGVDRILNVWRISDGVLLESRSLLPDTVLDIEFSSDGSRMVTGGTGNQKIKFWNVQDWTIIKSIDAYPGTASPVLFSPDSTQIYSGSLNMRSSFNWGALGCWDASTGSLLRNYLGSSGTYGTNVAALSPDGTLLAWGGSHDGKTRLIRTTDGEEIHAISHTNYARAVAFSRDGQHLAIHYNAGGSNQNNRLTLWRLSDYANITTLTTHLVNAHSLSFSPDGRMVATGGDDSTVRLYDVEEGVLISTLVFSSSSTQVRSIAFSPDGQLLAASGANNRTKIWRLSDGMLLHTLNASRYSVNHIAFSPDGKILVTGNGTAGEFEGSSIDFWRVSDGALLGSYDQEVGSAVMSVAFSPDSRYFAYGRWDATLVLAHNPFYRVPGDVNGDRCVEDTDLLAVLFAFGSTGGDEDLNNDGIVDDSDLLEVLFNYGAGCE